jgi:hypothetical protein
MTKRRIFYHDRQIGLTKPFPATIIEGLQELDMTEAMNKGKEAVDAIKDVSEVQDPVRCQDPEV